MNPTAQPRKRFGRGVIVSIIFWSIIAIALFNKQAISDWWRLTNYDPPTEIAQLATDTTMNDSARRLFYVYRPQVEPKEDFNEHCRSGEFTIVLGCYVEDKGIYLFEVSDERLQGVKEVTAAHELLHAAYDRLSWSEQEKVDALTKAAFESLDNQRIKETIAQYQEKDASSVAHELHAILGTEVRDLPDELEEYYAKYFEDRAQIVAYSESYEAAFSSRQGEADALASQLESLKEEIDAANAQLEAEGRALDERYQYIESQRDSADPDSFNAAVDEYNAALRAYNNKVASTSSQIDQYNALYEQYEAVVLEQEDLYKAIDSRPEALQAE